MPKYHIVYEVVESYDATIEGVFDHNSLTDAVTSGHWNGYIDRSWREGRTVRVKEFTQVTDKPKCYECGGIAAATRKDESTAPEDLICAACAEYELRTGYNVYPLVEKEV